MKYTAEITNKDIIEGLLTLQLRYTSEDRSIIIQDSISTRSPQNDQWLKNEIKRKITELEGLDEFIQTIEIGDFSLEQTNTKSIKTIDIDKEQYQNDLNEFNTLVGIISKEIITSNHEYFVSLHEKLKTNFKIEYIDLF